MKFALSTRWNASRHTSGSALIEEILELGIDRVELGYDLRLDLVPGVQEMHQSGAVSITSVHNYCPVPVGAPRGHPELYTLASQDRRERELAVRHTTKTIEFAAEMGASTVVMHSGNVDMKRLSPELFMLYAQGKQFSQRFEKMHSKLQVLRDKKVKRQLPFLYEGLEALLPVLEQHHMVIGIENLPTWEAIPTEVELLQLLQHFDSPYIQYWHDIGHGQVRENIRLINHERWLEKLAPYLAGMHVHDVLPPATDHVVPPKGKVDFTRFTSYMNEAKLLVLEPSSSAGAEELKECMAFFKKLEEQVRE